ncbi:slit homolog 3 protein-like [Mercenaria mercenaria]|uniref:slit homolog 3 protein-like n=1 Tax=Mercenaria mercenaria TaxID=6596 RepID=UPI00234F00E9|nr:slit homolog 3 protein-like [Mercenaria mercenaria]
MENIRLALLLVSMFSACAQAQQGKCPVGCYCKHRFVDCQSLMDFPLDLALDTERIRLSHMNIGEIPKHAFSYLPNVTLIEIEQSNVGIIAGCAFKNIYSLQEILFDKTVIGNVESFAFNGLSKMKRIEFLKSRIGRLKSFAFYQLSEIANINLLETNFLYFYSNALYGINNVSTMVLTSNNVSDIVTDAFRDVKVDNLLATSNTFWNMHCGVLDVMFQSANTFSFSSNTFYCNCSISWMLSTSGRQKYAEILPDSRCHGPGKMNETTNLANVKFSDLNCKNKKEDHTPTCNEIKIKILNPTCNPSGRPGRQGNGGTGEEGKGDNGASSLVFTFQIFVVSFITVFLTIL